MDDDSNGIAALEEAIAERKENARVPFVLNGKQWKLGIVAIVLTFLLIPFTTIGYIVLNNRTGSAACDAVEDSNEALIEFLVERMDDGSQVLVRDLAKVFDKVTEECQ